MKLLIDVDMVAYRNAAAVERNIDWGDGEPTRTTNVPLAKSRIDAQIGRWAEKFKADEVLVFLSGPDQFRKRVYPPYKQHRVTKVIPLARETLEEHLLIKHKAIKVNNLEADDLMGLEATQHEHPHVNTLIITIDKDLITVPGFTWNPTKPDVPPLLVDNLYADMNWMYQTLVGDVCDGFPGCPGMGPKRAEKLLENWRLSEEDFGGLWARVFSCFALRGLTEQDAITQARLARILRDGDYDPKTGEVILWHPDATQTYRTR